MTIAIILGFFLVAATCVLHFAALSIGRKTCGGGWKVLKVMFWVLGFAFIAHLLEIVIYAGGFFAADRVFGIGQIEGLKPKAFLDYFYFSSVTYTSLGLGDMFPSGHLRFLTGLEALNGLILITWTGSYTFFIGLKYKVEGGASGS